MPTPLRRRVRRARRGLAISAAVGLVLVAVLLGVASQLLPVVERNPERVAAWLSERAGQPVRFDAIETEWTRRGPLLRLDNLRIGGGDQGFAIGDTEMLVSVYAGLLPGTPFSELRLRNLDLVLERDAAGRWRVRGLPGQRQVVDPLKSLERLGELQVIDGKLAVIAPELGIEARIPRIDLRLQVRDERVLVGLRAWPDVGGADPGNSGPPVDVALDFDRIRGDGRAYLGSDRADLASWSSLLKLAGVTVEQGKGRVEAWAELRDHRVVAVIVDTMLRDVVLRATNSDPPSSANGAANARPAREAPGQVQIRARWQSLASGWRVDAPLLRVGDGERMQKLDGLGIAGGKQFGLVAERLDAGPLLAIVGLSDRVSPALRQWLRAAKPQASLSNVRMLGARGGAVHVAARIDGLGFQPVGEAPGLAGLAADVEGDGDGLVARLDAAKPVTFSWPEGFGIDHQVTLDGALVGWRAGPGWQLGTAGLDIQGEGFGVQARGGLQWQADGSRPLIDLAAHVDDTALTVAKGFWIRNRMSENLIGWLDQALVAGELRDGRAVMAGDLDDWPFNHNDGRFEATGRLHDATVKFNPDWLPVKQVDAQVKFIADGFQLEGTGRLGEVAIDSLTAGIDHYHDGRLKVDARGAGDAAQLLDILKQSPLQKQQADTFAHLSASGPARATFGLTLPLASGSRSQIDGRVELDGARLADSRWDLDMDQVSGAARYSNNGFVAEQLKVRNEGQPGRLTLRAGPGFVKSEANAFEAGLDATLAAATLLDRAPTLAWLKPHMAGRSPWRVGVAIPRAKTGGKSEPARLTLTSTLVGTAITLPAPLDKSAAVPLATTVETALPLESGEVRVAMGNRLALRARSGDAGTGIRIALGDSQVSQPPPSTGLVATGRATDLDALDWIAIARGGGSGEGGLPLREIDVTAQRLHLLGSTFPDTRVVVAPAQGGAIGVRADGQALSGTLKIADAQTSDGAVSGSFRRLFWRSDKPDPGEDTDGRPEDSVPAASPGTATVDAGSEIDPSRIPPLSLDIEDLRIGDARLGKASIRSRPTAAGMRVQQLRTRIDKQAIDITGVWTGRGTDARTRMAVAVDSDDLGSLLKGLGLGQRIGGGNGNIQFDALWPGSPAAFALATLEGRMQLEARDGRLLEVEPGAGRVLGLLSITELPRRLTLDFGDFFSKGFSFNTITGNVRFSDGVARSDDLLIDGPAAAIDIRGTANLRAQTYNQTIEVHPKAGNLLTAVGAIAGGPVGAAIGAAANAVLQKPLGDIAQRSYRVTGPWKDPKVEVVGRSQEAATPPDKSPAG